MLGRHRSQGALRIDVDRHAYAAARLRRLRQERTQIGLDVGLSGCVEQQAKAVAASDKRHRCFSRTQNVDLRSMRGSAAHFARKPFGFGLAAGADDDRRKPAEGWQAGLPPLVDLTLVEFLRVTRNKRLHDRMVRLIGLDQAAALQAAASGAARYLAQELESAFSSTRVSVGEAQIRSEERR